MVTAENLSHYKRNVIHHKRKPQTGRGGEEASRTTGGEPTGEEGNTMGAQERGEDEVISGENALPVDLMKAASKRSKEEEDQTGTSGLTGEMPWRWHALAAALAGQCRMAWMRLAMNFPNSMKGWGARRSRQT